MGRTEILKAICCNYNRTRLLSWSFKKILPVQFCSTTAWAFDLARPKSNSKGPGCAAVPANQGGLATKDMPSQCQA